MITLVLEFVKCCHVSPRIEYFLKKGKSKSVNQQSNYSKIHKKKCE